MEVLATDNSLHFFNEDTIPVKVYRDQDEWKVGHEEVGFFFSFFSLNLNQWNIRYLDGLFWRLQTDL